MRSSAARSACKLLHNHHGHPPTNCILQTWNSVPVEQEPLRLPIQPPETRTLATSCLVGPYGVCPFVTDSFHLAQRPQAKWHNLEMVCSRPVFPICHYFSLLLCPVFYRMRSFGGLHVSCYSKSACMCESLRMVAGA